jgi:hypothetical protein
MFGDRKIVSRHDLWQSNKTPSNGRFVETENQSA